MRSAIPMIIAKTINIFMSACFCAFGVIVLSMPELPESAVGLTIGILSVLLGVFKLVGYFSKDLFRLAFQYDLQLGTVLVLLGIVMLIKPEHVMEFICIIFGISIFLDGLFKISTAFESKKFGIKWWPAILAAAIVTCIYGAALMYFPFVNVGALKAHLGLALIWEGILNLIVIICTVKVVNHQKRDNPTDVGD